jgi:hypothetical protein
MSIYIVTRFEKSSLYSPKGEVLPGKGFLWGINQKKMGLGSFGGLLSLRILQRLNTGKFQHSIYSCYKSRDANNMSIYIVTRFEKSSLYSPQGEVFPGKEFLWGINQKKWGLEVFGGYCL